MIFSLLILSLASLSLAAIHNVDVGQQGLTFTPNAIFATPGDQVIFTFHAKNHSVTQSSFASPCGQKNGGFNSGFMPVPANQTDNLPTFTITVNDTSPIWIFCDQAANTVNSHCGAGMVFAVNCGQTGAANSFTNFQQSALAIGAALKADAAAGSTTAAYGGVTIPGAPSATPVTETIALSTSTWTTTYSSYPGSPNATPASSPQVIQVVVGGPGGNLFNPSRVSASPRDIISFQFQQKNHTVTQSSFADPCRPLNANGTVGFDSGFQFVPPNSTNFPVWNLTINDTSPIWAYCRQVGHCGSGMVFAVNSVENSPRNFSAFQGLAKTLNGTGTASNGTNTASSPGATNTSSALKTSASLGSLVLVLAMWTLIL